MSGKVIKMVSSKEPDSGRARLKFKRGEVVTLNSGGCGMTVRDFDGDVVVVEWQLDDGEPVVADYYYDMLSPLPISD